VLVARPGTRKRCVAFCRRCRLRPFRRYRQRTSAVQVIAPEAFPRGTLRPDFEAVSAELAKHLDAITDRVVREAIHGDVSDVIEGEPKALPASAGS
jgi:hypothetical protein